VPAVLVTGGTGFLGRHLVDALADEGVSVVSYNRDYADGDAPNSVAVQGELFDIPRLVAVLQEHRVERIIHTAAQSHPEISVELPLTTFAANVDGTLGVFEAARMSGVVRRIVNFSSECAYGHQDEQEMVTESACPLPNTPYGVTKVATELLGRVYHDIYDLDVVSLRVTEIYGPGLRLPEVLKDMIYAAAQHTTFRLDAGSSHRFQFVHVSDVVRAAVLACRHDRLPQHVYNISGGEQVTLAQAATLVRGVFPHATVDLGPGQLPGWDRQGQFDISAAERDFGYRPEVSLAEGIASYAAWLTEKVGVVA
jgi:UDP-glucose 4-epimerase